MKTALALRKLSTGITAPGGSEGDRDPCRGKERGTVRGLTRNYIKAAAFSDKARQAKSSGLSLKDMLRVFWHPALWKAAMENIPIFQSFCN